MTQTPSAAALTAFSFTTTQIRACLIDGQCWFVARDVFDALGITWHGTKSLAKIKDEWRGVTNLVTPLKNQHGSHGEQKQDLLIISEPAVYKIAFRSDKPEAERFTDRVAEIVTEIRKTGRYVAPAAEPLLRYVDLTTHPEMRHALHRMETRFMYSQAAAHNFWAVMRKIGGSKATEFPESQIPRALEEMKRLVARADQFFDAKAKFEQAAIKYVFGTDAELADAPRLDQPNQFALN